jgi:hypothetical protein
VLSAGLGANLNFGTMRQLVNEMSLQVGHGAGRSLEPGEGKGAFCGTWWGLELWNRVEESASLVGLGDKLKFRTPTGVMRPLLFFLGSCPTSPAWDANASKVVPC